MNYLVARSGNHRGILNVAYILGAVGICLVLILLIVSIKIHGKISDLSVDKSWSLLHMKDYANKLKADGFVKVLLVAVNMEQTGGLTFLFRQQEVGYLPCRTSAKIPFTKDKIDLGNGALLDFSKKFRNILAFVYWHRGYDNH